LLPDEVIIKEWSHIATGTHGTVTKAFFQNGEFEGYVCIKLFTEECKAAYERETLAYELLSYRGVRGCIPEAYWKGCFPWSRLNTETTDSDEEMYYWLVLEYFEDCRTIRFDKLDIPTAEALCRSVRRLHEGRVLHEDLQERNILLVKEGDSVRVVLIDFSCAWLQPHPKTLLTEYDSMLALLLREMVQLVHN